MSLNLLLVSTTFNAVFSQAVSIVEGKKSVDVGVSLCYCNSDLCNQVRRDYNNDWQDGDDDDHHIFNESHPHPHPQDTSNSPILVKSSSLILLLIVVFASL